MKEATTNTAEYTTTRSHQRMHSEMYVQGVSVEMGILTAIVTGILTIHMRIVYLRIAATEVVGLAGVTEVVGLAGVTEVVGLAGSPPAEDGCVQMLSSVTEDKLSEVSNGVNISCRFLVSVNVYLLVPNTSISARYKRPVDFMLILRYFPRASVVRFITTSLVPSSITSENIVPPVLVERRSALWTERLRSGILLGTLNFISTFPTHHPWGMSNTTKGLLLLSHPYTPREALLLSRSGRAPSLIAHVRSPPLTVHCP